MLLFLLGPWCVDSIPEVVQQLQYFPTTCQIHCSDGRSGFGVPCLDQEGNIFCMCS